MNDSPLNVGIPNARATSIDNFLSAITLSVSRSGPINVIPCLSQSCFNSGTSLKKPYPGWMASQPERSAPRTTSSDEP